MFVQLQNSFLNFELASFRRSPR